MAAKRKLIIDCDTGVDDAVAMLLAFDDSSNTEILAITCVNGNCTVDQAVHNTCLTLGVVKKMVTCIICLLCHQFVGELVVNIASAP